MFCDNTTLDHILSKLHRVSFLFGCSATLNTISLILTVYFFVWCVNTCHRGPIQWETTNHTTVYLHIHIMILRTLYENLKYRSTDLLLILQYFCVHYILCSLKLFTSCMNTKFYIRTQKKSGFLRIQIKICGTRQPPYLICSFYWGQYCRNVELTIHLHKCWS